MNQNKQNTDIQKQKFEQMTTAPVSRLIGKLAIPSMISMLISAAYNLADTFFIGKISTEATGAVGIVFAYMAITQAVGFYFGHGSGNYISRELGAQNTRNAEKMASTGFFTALTIGIAITLAGLIAMKPLLKILGATETIMPEAESYFLYILLATPFIMGSFVLNNQLRLQGNAKFGMFGIMSGAILNIILDPLLIFTFKMGIAGAAIATAFSQAVGFTVLLIMCNTSGIKIRLKNFSLTLQNIVEINAGGLPSLCRQGLASVATICLNHAAGAYGDSAIAAFSVVGRATFIATAALLGFGQGFQPVCGFNYGAKLYDRVKKAFWFCVKSSFFVLVALAVLGYIFAGDIVSFIRSDDPLLIKIGTKALQLQCITFPLTGFIVMSNMFLQNTRKTARATVLAVARQGVIFIPVMFVMSGLFGLFGLQATQPVADILTFFLAIPLGISGLKEMQDDKALL